MSVVVMAYHEMGCAGLRTLLARGTDVSAVFTYEDDPRENIWFGSVAEIARAAGLAVFTTERINDAEWVERLRALSPDVIFSFYYRHILGREILAVPRYGAVNLHGSLLPRYRGRCPVNWQLIHGETVSGVTLHYMTTRADAGDIIGQESIPVGPDETAIELYRKLVGAAERLLARHLEAILAGTAERRPQDPALATTFGGRRPEDGRIDWSAPARAIHDLVRAVAPPWPGAFTELDDGRLRIHRTRPLTGPAGETLEPGEIRLAGAGRVLAGTGDGLLELLEYETPSGRPLRSGERAGLDPARKGPAS